jgi:hypothetical protein
MHKRTFGLAALTLACLLSGCDYIGASRPPWLFSATPPQRAHYSSYSAYRHSHSNERTRSAHTRYASRESGTATTADLSTTPRADHAVADRPALLPAAATNPPVSLSLAGDSGDRERAQHLLESADQDLVRARRRRLSAAQEETYERATQLARRARRALAENDCAAASSLAGKASSLAAGIGGE